MANPWRYLDSLHLVVVSPDGRTSASVDSDEILQHIADGGLIDSEERVATPQELRELAAVRLRAREMFRAAEATARVDAAVAAELARCPTEGRA
jgi:hypothetical protein